MNKVALRLKSRNHFIIESHIFSSKGISQAWQE
ncbi:hypothetical protein SAMN05192556_1132 [Halomonas caseinilytica]|uniref:Uncharacterized protein n=1 Tax=Halomonas caseinilytica TaxID=438744 RepID=A0A1M7AAK5_9GAMM|nr:hypothetical protein SAMN05192556_1132 [Halomonas caseinilytica]